MPLIHLLLLLTVGTGFAQIPERLIHRDSVPTVFPPDLMPQVRPHNSFHRVPAGLKTRIRATLDNMQIKILDSSTQYTMLHSYPNQGWSDGTKPLWHPKQYAAPQRPRKQP